MSNRKSIFYLQSSPDLAFLCTPRKLLGVSQEAYEEMKMHTTPVSYLVQKNPVMLPLGEDTFPIGCGLSYQVNRLRALFG